MKFWSPWVFLGLVPHNGRSQKPTHRWWVLIGSTFVPQFTSQTILKLLEKPQTHCTPNLFTVSYGSCATRQCSMCQWCHPSRRPKLAGTCAVVMWCRRQVTMTQHFTPSWWFGLNSGRGSGFSSVVWTLDCATLLPAGADVLPLTLNMWVQGDELQDLDRVPPSLERTVVNEGLQGSGKKTPKNTCTWMDIYPVHSSSRQRIG